MFYVNSNVGRLESSNSGSSEGRDDTPIFNMTFSTRQGSPTPKAFPTIATSQIVVNGENQVEESAEQKISNMSTAANVSAGSVNHCPPEVDWIPPTAEGSAPSVVNMISFSRHDSPIRKAIFPAAPTQVIVNGETYAQESLERNALNVLIATNEPAGSVHHRPPEVDWIPPSTKSNVTPVVDLASLHQDLLISIQSACKQGFFQVINHGVSFNILRKLQTQAQEFFTLAAGCSIYTPAKNVSIRPRIQRCSWRDTLEVTYASASTAVPVATAPELTASVALEHLAFRKVLDKCVSQQQKLSRKLLQLIDESLGLEKGSILHASDGRRTTMVVNCYPHCPEAYKMGIREHYDPYTIALLSQNDLPGLQVFQHGSWVNILPLDGALVVILGDHIQTFTSGRYSSCLHRVTTNKETPRLSMSLFTQRA